MTTRRFFLFGAFLLALAVLACSATLGSDASPAHDGAPGHDPDMERVFGLATLRIDQLLERVPAEQAEQIRIHAERLERDLQEFGSRRSSAQDEFEERRRQNLERFPESDEPEASGAEQQALDERSVAVRDDSAGDDATTSMEHADAEIMEQLEETSRELPSVTRQSSAQTADLSQPSSKSSGHPIGLSANQERSLMAEGVRRFSLALDQASRTYDLRRDFLLCIMKIESAYDIDAVSRAGALGLMQLMPGTADDLGVNPYDLTQNVIGGAKLINELLVAYSGNIKLAMAAYNAGPGAVKRYNGVPPYPETQGYVRRITQDCGRARR